MGQYSQSQPQTGSFLPLQEFLSRISNVRETTRVLSSTVKTISTLQQRALDVAEPTPDPALAALIDQARGYIASVRDAIRFLVRDISITKSVPGASKTLVDTKQGQLNAAKSSFEKEVQAFLQAEAGFQARYRDQIARQYRIVRPDASEAEVQAAVTADWSDQGVFQQALTQSSRQVSAQRVLGSVRDRHVELQAIEGTMTELAMVMREMATLVEEQDVRVEQVTEAAEQTAENLGEAREEVVKSVGLARLVRRHKWMCFGLTVLIILIIIAIALAVYFTNRR
jgi:syntaxin 1B/2/3